MADQKNDEYQSVKFYADNTTAKKSGFSKFELDKAFYFCRYVDGNIAMLSQSYKSAAGRDNGIESVKKNEKLAKRYVFESRGRKHNFALKAGNGQEIAISPDYASLAEAERVSSRLTGRTVSRKKVEKATATKTAKKAKDVKTKPSKTKKPTTNSAAFSAADSRIENYRPLSFYEKNGGNKDGYNSFEQDGAHYFHFNKGREIILISESYTSKAGRDNGIASVKKNMKLKTAYQHHKHKNGQFYFDINAANKQEIATSRWYPSKSKALAAAADLRGETTRKTGQNVEQNYMPLAFYKKATQGKSDGFETFKGEDGEHYFTYFENGKITLISEGYPTAAIRDKGMASVEKNIKLEERYVFGKGADGKDGFVLRAGNNKEIARSIGYGSAAAAAAGAAYLIGTRKRPAASAATPVTPPKPTPAAKSEPAPRPKSEAPIATAAAGTAALAGAAAMAATAKPSPVAETMKAAPIVENAAVAPAGAAPMADAATAASVATSASVPPVASTGGGAGIWRWLKWLLLGLLALLAAFFLFKSCVGDEGKEKENLTGPTTTMESAAAAARVSCWDGSKAESDAACPTKITCWDGSFATSQADCSVEPVARDIECWDGTTVKEGAACPPEPTTNALSTSSSTAVGTTIKSTNPKLSVGNQTIGATTAKMTAPSIAGRICGPSATVLFDVSASKPINVTRLGTNPQFGESLSYTPEEFFRRLQVKYRTSPRDKSFLDLMARSLGYGAFAEMDASMFSNDRLENGSSGLLGFGAQHALQFSTLNVSDPTHLEAFRVRSANGTDVHFMKRCGNYMYVCRP